MATLTVEDYDELLDAIDTEDTDRVLELFIKFDLEPHSNLLDAPRICFNNDLITYLDYVLAYNLTNVIDLFIDEINIEIDDEILAQSILLNNLDTYKYLCNLGYTPEGQTLKAAIKLCCSEIVDNILSNNSDFIELIDEEDIDNLFSSDIDEETVETLRVLLNYNINSNLNANLFKTHLDSLKELQNENLDNNLIENQDIIFEIIDLLENWNIE